MPKSKQLTIKIENKWANSNFWKQYKKEYYLFNWPRNFSIDCNKLWECSKKEGLNEKDFKENIIIF